jgi:hypothetical protein
MKLIKRKAPSRLSRVIVALAASTGKKLTWSRNNNPQADAASAKELNRGPEHFEGYVRLSERSTITVETERLLVVRRGRFSP